MCIRLHRSLLLPAEPFPINKLHGIRSIQNLARSWDWFQHFWQKKSSFMQQIFGIQNLMNDQNSELITKLWVDKSASYLISSVLVQNMLSGLGVNQSETVTGWLWAVNMTLPSVCVWQQTDGAKWRERGAAEFRVSIMRYLLQLLGNAHACVNSLSALGVFCLIVFQEVASGELCCNEARQRWIWNNIWAAVLPQCYCLQQLQP